MPSSIKCTVPSNRLKRKKPKRKVISCPSGRVRKRVEKSICDIFPSPENDDIYGAVDHNDSTFLELVDDIRKNGILQALVVTADGYILSGHRRYAAGRAAGLTTVPCEIDPIRRTDDFDAFVRLLVAHNNQRIKTFTQKLHEEVIKLDPGECYERLIAERAERAEVKAEPMDLGPRKRRSRISDLKRPMLDAVLDILDRIHKPTSDRKVFYELLNKPPLRNAKTKVRFGNNDSSWKDLCDLLTRARLEGFIPWQWIVDETRPVTTWDVHRDPQCFVGAAAELH